MAEKHGGKTDLGNLASACARCNQHKGTDLTSIDPTTGGIVRLFNPRIDRWTDHFKLVGTIIEPITAEGRTTVKLLRLNRDERLEERAIMLVIGLLNVEK